MSKTVYRIVADRLIAELDKGVIPWRKPWSPINAPQNYISRRPYHGVNRVLLSRETDRTGCPYFATLKQIRSCGGRVLDSEFRNPSIVTFWRWIEVKDEITEEKKIVPFLRYFRVWNLTQTEGIEWSPPEVRQINPIPECETIVARYADEGGPIITHDGYDNGWYNPHNDSIHLPTRESFEGDLFYFSTLFHECAHSTGHPSRLNRIVTTNMRSTAYAKEELIAEMTAAMLLGSAGFLENAPIKRSASYFKFWIDLLKDDPRCVVWACSQAEKAADWIVGKRMAGRGKEHEEVLEVNHVAA